MRGHVLTSTSFFLFAVLKYIWAVDMRPLMRDIRKNFTSTDRYGLSEFNYCWLRCLLLSCCSARIRIPSRRRWLPNGYILLWSLQRRLRVRASYRIIITKLPRRILEALCWKQGYATTLVIYLVLKLMIGMRIEILILLVDILLVTLHIYRWL